MDTLSLSLFSVLAVLLVCSIVLSIKKYIQLFVKQNTDQVQIGKIINLAIKDENLATALEKSVQLKKQPIGQVSEAGIRAAMENKGRDGIHKAMDDVSIPLNDQNDKYLNYFALIANLSTFFALLASVGIMIKSMAIVKDHPEMKEQIFSSMLSLAGNLTLGGLAVAIPSLIMYAVFQNRAARVSDSINKASLNVFIFLGEHFKGQ